MGKLSAVMSKRAEDTNTWSAQIFAGAADRWKRAVSIFWEAGSSRTVLGDVARIESVGWRESMEQSFTWAHLIRPSATFSPMRRRKPLRWERECEGASCRPWLFGGIVAKTDFTLEVWSEPRSIPDMFF